MSLLGQINKERLPKHVAIIMDGNGRWAKGQGKFRVFGHHKGVDTVKEITETAAELGIKYLTLYAFSTENWSRPKAEVNALMDLLVKTIKKEMPTLMKNNIRLDAIGNMDSLPNKCLANLNEAKEKTSNNSGMTLVLALSYSAKWDIAEAVKRIALDVQQGLIKQNDIDDHLITRYLSTHGIPEPELLIRTSGELRISNFLLWEIAYSELYFTDVLWPDFSKEELFKALIDYQNRERRFGKISEQLTS
ncbi:MAG: isoprenyl transferase [Bacteroidota bacterium]|nr:isoprenyl transferase [Bacteroidota bacterium]MDX5431236.1 isoprenyl transferase [Bacteroidota bacterium]MDX5469975.1 isoprenyl transferase [Bacteroidota bacterium]